MTFLAIKHYHTQCYNLVRGLCPLNTYGFCIFLTIYYKDRGLCPLDTPPPYTMSQAILNL